MEINNAIIENACNGDQESFEMIVSAYERQVISVLYRMINDIETARELAQDVFLKVYKALPRFSVNEDASFSSWLFTIVRNTCFSYTRKKRITSFFSIFSSKDNFETRAESDLPDEALSAKELRHTIDVHVSKLPEKQRMIFVFREYEHLSYEQIAEVMSCPVGTVRSNLSRARENLKEALKGYLSD